MDVERLRADIAGALPSGPLILTGAVLVAEATTAAAAAALGVERVMAIGLGRGTGALPDDLTAEVHVIDPGPADSLMAAMRGSAALLEEPPAGLVELVEAFDPEHQAWVMLDPTSRQQSLCDRPVFGSRQPAWWELEDKTTNDALFDAAGVARAPSLVVEPDEAPAAARTLDAGNGTVWSGDALEGFNGGAEYVRIVDDHATADEALAFFQGRVRHVRVAPYLAGMPCSIHGLVHARGVATLRPMEILNFRVAGRSQLLYGGVAEGWTAPEDVTAELQQAARRVGEHLSQSVGYRGAFGIDGILTAHGFRPTELNPRLSGGFIRMQRSLQEVPLRLLDAVLRAGTLQTLDDDFEAWASERLSRSASPRLGMPLTHRANDEQVRLLIRDDHGCWSWTDDEDPATARLTLGPAPLGGFLRVEATDRWVWDGSPVRSEAVAILELADEAFGLDLGRIAG